MEPVPSLLPVIIQTCLDSLHFSFGSHQASNFELWCGHRNTPCNLVIRIVHLNAKGEGKATTRLSLVHLGCETEETTTAGESVIHGPNSDCAQGKDGLVASHGVCGGGHPGGAHTDSSGASSFHSARKLAATKQPPWGKPLRQSLWSTKNTTPWRHNWRSSTSATSRRSFRKSSSIWPLRMLHSQLATILPEPRRAIRTRGSRQGNRARAQQWNNRAGQETSEAAETKAGGTSKEGGEVLAPPPISIVQEQWRVPPPFFHPEHLELMFDLRSQMADQVYHGTLMSQHIDMLYDAFSNAPAGKRCLTCARPYAAASSEWIAR
jgi:hypothetical protein